MLPRWPRPPSKICSRPGPDWDITRARAIYKKRRAQLSSLPQFPGRLFGAARIARRRRLHGGGGGQHRVRDAACGAGWKCSAGVEPSGGGARRHQIAGRAKEAAGAGRDVAGSQAAGRVQSGADGVGRYGLCAEAAIVRRLPHPSAVSGAATGARKSVAAERRASQRRAGTRSTYS